MAANLTIKNRFFSFFIVALGIFLLAFATVASAQKPTKDKKAKAKTDDTTASAEPDKVLYDRAMADMKRARYTEGRLSLQTLINTYPDSEYLAKAKLAQADSYYKEGGTSNITQAISEYKDFITFFPFLDEASYAQMQVGMAHYKMMEKSDRDTTQALAAEDEFQAFLLKYPQSPLAPDAEQKLRDVQEVLADGEFKVARFYYVKQDYRASAARLVQMTDRYPLYSGSDQALWMLGDVYSRAKQLSKNEDDKNHWADVAASCYGRILKDYPLSKYAPDAKARLTSMGMPVPAADPAAVARMQKEQAYESAHRQNALLKMPLEMLKSNPDVATAAHSGAPNLSPPTDAISATDILKPGAAGPSFGIAASSAGGAGVQGSADTTITEGGGAVTEGSSGSTIAAGAEIIEAPGPVQPGTAAVAPSSAPTETAAPPANTPPSNPPFNNPAPGAAASPTTNPPAPSTPVNPPTANAAVGESSSTPSSTPATGTPGDPGTATPAATKDGAAAPATPAAATPGKADDSKESSSKKKKGIHKIIPW
jgi:outer membrane protein assembly factor BamD